MIEYNSEYVLSPKTGLRAKVDEEGRILIPAEALAKLGLRPGTEAMLEDAPDGVILRARHNVRINDARLNPSQGRCPFIETGAVTVSWDGAVSPCLGLIHSHVSYLYDNPRAVSRYVIGNVNETALSEIWNDADYLAFRKRVQYFDFSSCSTWCGGCDMAEANQEDCFGNTFPTCGRCLWHGE